MSDESPAPEDAKEKAGLRWWFILGALCVVLTSFCVISSHRRIGSKASATFESVGRTIGR